MWKHLADPMQSMSAAERARRQSSRRKRLPDVPVLTYVLVLRISWWAL
jgi:hypothetical protein